MLDCSRPSLARARAKQIFWLIVLAHLLQPLIFQYLVVVFINEHIIYQKDVLKLQLI